MEVADLQSEPPATVLPFPAREYRHRWRRLQGAMAAAGFEALLITAQSNFEYMTGYRTPVWLIKSRPLLAALPSDGDPTVVLSASHAADSQGESLVREVRAYDGFEREAVQTLCDTIRDLRLDRGRWGVEAGLEQRLGLSLETWSDVVRAFPEARFEDASACSGMSGRSIGGRDRKAADGGTDRW